VLQVVSHGGIPERFVLIVPGDGLHMSSQVIWRKGYRIGVKFEPATAGQ
jgi:hypothetical protein